MPSDPGTPSPFDSLLESFLTKASQFVTDVMPTCNVCGRKAIPVKCANCEEFACMDHGFFNVRSGQALCGLCIEELLEGDGDGAVDGFPWSVLDVDPDASADEIKAAYHEQARKWHPDVCQEPDAETRFKEIQKAYRVASDMVGGGR